MKDIITLKNIIQDLHERICEIEEKLHINKNSHIVTSRADRKTQRQPHRKAEHRKLNIKLEGEK